MLPCEKLDLCVEFRDQLYLPLISVWGGRVHVAGVWLCPDEQEGEQEQEWSLGRLCTSSLQCHAPDLGDDFGEVQGGGQRLSRACPALRSDLSQSSTRSPPRLAAVILYLWLLWKQL